jgi:ribosomal protein S18 acetylase RimI-like enzyme
MTARDLEFRVALPDDAADLAAFAEQMFRDTFGPDNRAEDMDAYCGAAFAVAQVRRELGDPARHTVVALLGGERVGYAQLRAGSPPAFVAGDAPLEILRFYVARAWHGRGIADALMAHMIDAAHQRGARTLYLAVWERNHRAAAFYARHGFSHVGSIAFLMGSDRQTDDVMVRAAR